MFSVHLTVCIANSGVGFRNDFFFLSEKSTREKKIIGEGMKSEREKNAKKHCHTIRRWQNFNSFIIRFYEQLKLSSIHFRLMKFASRIWCKALFIRFVFNFQYSSSPSANFILRKQQKICWVNFFVTNFQFVSTTKRKTEKVRNVFQLPMDIHMLTKLRHNVVVWMWLCLHVGIWWPNCGNL